MGVELGTPQPQRVLLCPDNQQPPPLLLLIKKIMRRTIGARGYEFELFQSNFQLYQTIFLVYLGLS